MLRSLTLERFKSFEHARIDFGGLTTIVGPNASGKSNLRDALRFLHGIGRGYTLAEIIGEKWGEGGVLQWRGIRGGIREIAYNNGRTFALKLDFDFLDRNQKLSTATYRIEAGTPRINLAPAVLNERLETKAEIIFDAVRAQGRLVPLTLPVAIGGAEHRYPETRPVLSQVVQDPQHLLSLRRGYAVATMRSLEDMRFLDLSPDAMRLPSISGQLVLGDRGENLSSVLQAICADEQQKRGLLEWLRELTPMDVVDLEFPADQTGRVLVTLVEESGRRVSAYSASDGTLRFLAMLAALLGPERAKFYFFEELENGLHPTRLALLLQLIEQQTATGEVQVVATTHSPQLLNLLSPESRAHVYESYRLEGSESTSLKRVMDLPDAERIVAQQGLGRLHESGWIEDAVAFTAPEPAE